MGFRLENDPNTQPKTPIQHGILLRTYHKSMDVIMLSNSFQYLNQKFFKKKNNLTNFQRLSLGLMALMLGSASANVIVFADDSSIDKTFLIKWPGTPQTHDYIQFTMASNATIKDKIDTINPVFCANPEARNGHECTAIKVSKKVGCSAGELLEVKGNAFYCDHVLIGYGKKQSMTGKPVELFNFNGIIPEGKLFAYGGNPDSYDSRYYGFVDVESVTKLIGIIDLKPFFKNNET